MNSSRRLHWEPPALESVQTLLPQYRFLSLIGQGGMGAVFKAIQISLNRPVAIKVLPADLMSDEESNHIARFRQEAFTLARLNHPGIVVVFETGEAGDLLYIVMEFVEGVDLARRIAAEGPLTPEVASDFLIQVCEALDYAHRNGVIHRDLKPANLLLTPEGRVKIADFGLAKHNGMEHAGLTRSHVAVGTSDFMAPEAMTPGMVLDQRADIFALGVTLYQALTGEVPRGLWKAPSARSGVDPRFDSIVDRSMEPDREHRYRSSLELARDLDAIQRISTTPVMGRQEEKGMLPIHGALLRLRRMPRLWKRVATTCLAVGAGLAVPIPGSWLEPKWPHSPPRWHLSLDGTNQFVRIPTNAVPLTGNFTIECWLNLQENPPLRLNAILSQATEDGWPRFLVGVWPNGEVSVGDVWSHTEAFVPLGGWHHLALVRDSDDTRIYVDGTLKARHGTAIPNPGSAPWTDIGRQLDERRGGLPGGVGEMRIWNIARRQASIRLDNGKAFGPDEPGLLVRYAFDEEGGGDAVNRGSGGAGMTGKLMNGLRGRRTGIAEADTKTNLGTP